MANDGFDNQGSNEVLKDISFIVPQGKVTTVLGSNGSGKSTLFYLMTKNLPIQQGEILLGGNNVQNIRLKDFAKRVAIVNQTNTVSGDIIVGKLVEYGRTPLSFVHAAHDKRRRAVG